MSQFQYSGILFTHILTHSIDQEAIYSDDGIDYLYTKFVFSMQAYLNTKIAPATVTTVNQPVTVNAGDVTDVMKSIRHTLLQPRRVLAYWIDPDSEPLLKVGDLSNVNPRLSGGAIAPDSSATDAKAGPFPKSCRISRVSGTETLIVDYTVETYVVECSPETGTGTPVPDFSSHRFRETLAMDENFYTTRTRAGKVIIRADNLKGQDSVDVIRPKIIPSIPAGFKRERMSFAVQEDGLQMIYEITDREQFLLPPKPATKASGNYSETSTMGGALKIADCSVTLEGPNTKEATKDELLKTAFLIAFTKITGEQNPGRLDGQNNKPILKSVVLREELWENKVSISVKAQIVPTRKRFKGRAGTGVPATFPGFGTPLPGVPKDGTPPDPGAYGTSGLFMLINSFQDPCGDSPNTPQNLGGGKALGTAGKGASKVTVHVVGKLPQDNFGLHNDAAHQKGIVTQYQVHARWKTNEHVAAMPLAKAAFAISQVFVTLANPTDSMIVEWTIQRIGAQPNIPDPEPDDPNAKLIKKIVAPVNIEPEGDGTVNKYTVSGQYIYEFKKAPVMNFKSTPLIKSIPNHQLRIWARKQKFT